MCDACFPSGKGTEDEDFSFHTSDPPLDVPGFSW